MRTLIFDTDVIALEKRVIHELAVRSEEAEIAEVLARELVERLAKRHIPQPPAGHMGFLVRGYAVRKADVSVLRSFISAFGLCAMASTTGASSLISAKVGLVGTLVELFRDIWTKGVMLDEDKARILGILVANVKGPSDAGLTLDEIVTILRRTSPDTSAKAVDDHLKLLAKHPSRDGATKELVSIDVKQRWRPHV